MKLVMVPKYAPEDSRVESKKELNEMIRKGMKKQYGSEKVAEDKNGNAQITVNTLIIAVKDQYAKEWCFVNFKEGAAMNSMLFSKQVLDKLSTYK